MKIKTKIYFGIIFLFIEFFIVSAISIYSTYTLSERLNNMTKDNLLSVQYAESMIRTIDKINEKVIIFISNPDKTIDPKGIKRYIDQFEIELANEEENVTEIGEKDLVFSLHEKFNHYKSMFTKPIKHDISMYINNQHLLYNDIKSDIFKISNLNMQTILQKNEQVSALTKNFNIWISLIATLFFLVSFSFVFNFPAYIIGPIDRFTEIINKFSKSRNDLPLQYKSNDEFKELANTFNDMAERLDKLESASKAKQIKQDKTAYNSLNGKGHPAKKVKANKR
jgi:two-component system, NtrC family, sensor histidine kinase KinB